MTRFRLSSHCTLYQIQLHRDCLTDEETEAQRGQVICPGHVVTQGWAPDVTD